MGDRTRLWFVIFELSIMSKIIHKNIQYCVKIHDKSQQFFTYGNISTRTNNKSYPKPNRKLKILTVNGTDNIFKEAIEELMS